MDKKIIFLILLILLLAFLFPKSCGTWSTGAGIETKECSCLGLKTQQPIKGGGEYKCIGIPTSEKCYFNQPPDEKIPNTRKVEVSCN
jgi:hypothetical protein